MSHQQLKPLVTILATATIITTIMYIILKQTDFSSPKQLYSLVSFVVLVDNLLLLLFVKFLWKQRALRGWLVSVPNLNGCWIGEIQSTWVDPLTSKRIDPIPVILNVKQTYLGLSAVMITGEMRSESISYQFLYDKEKQINQLIYTYKSTPKQTIKSHPKLQAWITWTNRDKSLCGGDIYRTAFRLVQVVVWTILDVFGSPITSN